jgi:predicted ATPase
MLNKMQGLQKKKFEKFISHMIEIFPSVSNLSIAPIDNESTVEILLWPNDHGDDRSEAFSLADSGTGISQVLTILYLAMQPEECIVVIDEVNSFLHPSALRTMIRILDNNYPQHQYIISTHSTDVISWTNPDQVILIQKDDSKSRSTNIDIKDVNNIRILAQEIGFSMSDVFQQIK